MIFKRILKKLLYRITGRASHLKINYSCERVWYGNNYGGFYVCPSFINDKSIVYSFGVGEDMSFDTAIISKHRCEVFCFDPTPKSIQWFKQQKVNEYIHFFEFGIGDKNEVVNFYLPKNTAFVSGSSINQKNTDVNRSVQVEMKSLTSIMDELGHTHLDVLKMDIEGSEYTVLENILKAQIPIKQIVIEFHDRLFPDGIVKTKRAINQLNECGYKIFAVSESFEEISFINTKYQ